MAVNAGLGTASLRVIANTTVFEQTLKRSIKRMSALTAGIFATAAAGNFLGSAVKDALALEASVARIQTFLKDQPQDWKAAFDAEALRDLSNELGISVDKIGESVYYMIGSGVQLNEVFDAVRAAASTAIATNSDLGLTANFTSTILNAYRGETDKLTGSTLDAAHANDVFFRALAEGKGSANDLAKYISTVVPSASALGVGLGDIAAQGAAATLTGKSARKVFTGLQYVMTGLGDETKGIGEAFKEISGKSFADFIKDGGKVADAIKLLGSEVGQAQIAQLEGAKTGQIAIQELLQIWPQYEAIVAKVAGTSGDAADAMDIVNQSTQRQLEFLKTRFQNFRGAVGDWLLPVITAAVVRLDQFREQWNAYWPTLREKIVEIIEFIKPIFTGLWDFIAGIDWQGLVNLIGTAFATVGAMFAPVVLAIREMVDAMDPGLTGVINGVIGWLQSYSGVITIVVGSLVAYRVATMTAAAWTATYGAAVSLLTAIKTAYQVRLALLNVAVLGYALSNGVAATSVGVLTRAQLLLNAAFAANPIGFILTVLAALATAFYVAWTKSETFRDIVVGTFNKIKDVGVTAIEYLVNYLLEVYVKKPLQGFQKLLDGLAHLPDWLGGGKFQDASNAIGRVIDGVGAIQNAVHEMANEVRAADWELDNLFKQAERAAHAGLWFGNAETDAALVAALAGDSAMPEMPKMPKIPKMPDFSGGNYDPDAKKKAADAAKEAARLLKQALGRVKADLDRISKNIFEQPIDKIRENFKQLYADMKDAKASKSLIAWAKKQESALVKLAKKRDKLLEQYTVEKQKLDDLKDEYDDFYKSVRDSFLDLADITSTGYETFEGIYWRMQRVLDTSREFASAISKLQNTNLDRDILRDIIEAGPVAGLNAANAILEGGQEGINALNKVQRDIEKIAGDTAKKTSDGFYAAGIAAAEGLVAGLESQLGRLEKAMEGLATVLVKKVKSELKIKSPSQVFADEVGAQITAGMAEGITGNMGMVGSAASAVSAKAVNYTSMAGDGGSEIHIHATGPTLQDIVRVEIRNRNRAMKNNALAGSSSGTIRK